MPAISPEGFKDLIALVRAARAEFMVVFPHRDEQEIYQYAGTLAAVRAMEKTIAREDRPALGRMATSQAVAVTYEDAMASTAEHPEKAGDLAAAYMTSMIETNGAGLSIAAAEIERGHSIDWVNLLSACAGERKMHSEAIARA